MVDAVQTYSAPEPNANQPDAATAAKMIEQAKSKDVPSIKTEIPDGKPAAKAVTPDPDRPAWLKPKFKTPEQLAKAYDELEKKMGASGNEPKVEETPVVPPKATGLDALKLPETASEAAKALEASGLKMEKYEAEWAKDGKIGDESRAELAKAGIDQRIVDGYIAGQQALAEKVNADLHAIAGGEEQFEQMFAWSAQGTNLSDTERGAVNKALESKDHAQIKLAFKAVHAAWIADVGSEPAVQMRGGTGGGSGGDVYTSMEGILKDMASSEYKTNEEYRDKIIAKVKRSNLR